MGIHQRYKENRLQIHELLGVPSNEPIFIIRAQDKFSIATLSAYKDVAHVGTIIGEESEEWIEDLGSIRNDFINWQRDNRDKVKVPD